MYRDMGNSFDDVKVKLEDVTALLYPQTPAPARDRGDQPRSGHNNIITIIRPRYVNQGLPPCASREPPYQPERRGVCPVITYGLFL